MKTTEIPKRVRDLAAGIADEIERRGHYQGLNTGVCCLVINSQITSDDVAGELWNVLQDDSGRRDLITWNDRTPTPEVLATLRKIAAGERP